jgi:pSer/pThr/pTyr-binding forkhead associated (FHA) protein
VATVSAKHCLLELRDGIWFVFDLASRNGIRINGVKCQEGRVLPGNTLSVAECCFHLVYADAAADPAAVLPARPQAGEPNTPLAAVPPELAPAERHDHPPQAQSHSGTAFGELIPCGGGVPIRLRKTRLVIGRSPACDIVLPMPVVSSQHCRLDFQEGFWHVRDLGSRNGIRVDGLHESSKYLKPGAILSIAEQRFLIAYLPQAAGPPDEEVSVAVVPAAAAPVSPEVDDDVPQQSDSDPNTKNPGIQVENEAP